MIAFPSPNIRYLITQGDSNSDNFSSKKEEILRTVRLALEKGIELVQIREKQLPARSLAELVRSVAELASGTDTKILVNERFDVAMSAGAHGVQLTSSSIPVEAVRRQVPRGFIIGVSTHSVEEVVVARDGGADFALFGPIFSTPGKGDPVGLQKLSEVCERVAPFPVMAVGGIDETNCKSVLEAGAAGFAAIRYLNEFVKMP